MNPKERAERWRTYACAAMQGLLAEGDYATPDHEDLAHDASALADAMVEKEIARFAIATGELVKCCQCGQPSIHMRCDECERKCHEVV